MTPSSSRGCYSHPSWRFVRDGHFIMVEEDVVITPEGARKLSPGCEILYTIEA